MLARRKARSNPQRTRSHETRGRASLPASSSLIAGVHVSGCEGFRHACLPSSQVRSRADCFPFAPEVECLSCSGTRHSSNNEIIAKAPPSSPVSFLFLFLLQPGASDHGPELRQVGHQHHQHHQSLCLAYFSGAPFF